ncbi:MAG: acylphosphatase [Caldilineales bacterium]
MSDVRAHIVISGHVQGVFFRGQTQRRANALGVAGWVRNLPDGKVEAVFEGEEASVNELIAWCRHGPPNAWVSNVEVRREPYTGDLRSFSVRY